MTMFFRQVKASIIDNVLEPAAAGRFSIVGYQRQVKPGERDNTVDVFFRSGSFSKGSSAINGPTTHDITFEIYLIVSKAAKGDLAVLNNQASTDEERATALTNFQLAAKAADDGFDELAEIVYQILMDAQNQDLGMPKGDVSNRWIDRIEKNEPVGQGSNVILAGSMNLTCRVVEPITGASVVFLPEPIIESNIDLAGDDVAKTGVTATN